MTLVEHVASELARLTTGAAGVGVAVSGGPDSIALLDLLVLGAAIHGRRLVALHVDHGIHPGSADVAAAVAVAAASRGVPLATATLALAGSTSETRARIARRRSLLSLARQSGVSTIVLAHHADDQAETVLLRLLRGSGPAGLAAMSPRRGPWVRPLLAVRRSELLQHLAGRDIETWTDPANSDPKHLRSWLRTEIMPRLERRLPDLVERIDAARRQARDARAAWDGIPELIPALEFVAGDGTISVAAPPLRGYRSAVRDALIAAIGRRSGAILGARRLAAIAALLSSGDGSRRIRVSRRLEVELAFDRLTFHQAAGLLFQPAIVESDAILECGRHRLVVAVAPATGAVVRGGWSTELVRGRYIARPWQRGDRIRPLGGTGSRAVATMMREARIAPLDRIAWPVICTGDDATVVWVPGICRSETMIPQRGTEGLHVDCTVA